MESKFRSVVHCAVSMIHEHPEWNNAKIAETVSSIMGTNTKKESIAWYKGKLRKGELKLADFVKLSGQAVELQLEVVAPKPIEPPNVDIQLIKDSFPSIAHCAIYLICLRTDWSNKQIASEVSRIMGSRTGSSNISWYKGKLKSGKLPIDKFTADLQKKQAPVEPPKMKDEFEIPSELVVTEDDLIQSKGLQKLALQFFRDRSERSFNALYERIKPGMVKHAKKLLNNDEELANDVVSTALVKVWSKIDQYNKYWNFSTWAYRIVYNEAMQCIRKEKMTVGISQDFGDNGGGIYEMSLMNRGADEELLSVAPVWNIDEASDFQQDVYEKVLDDMNSLPDTYKEILVDRELNNLKYKQIAEKRGININSVKTQIKRARTKIIEENRDYYKMVQNKNKKNKKKKPEPDMLGQLVKSF